MKIFKFKGLFASLAATASFLSAGSVLAQFLDPGDLTVTVQENSNGSLTISASGTANVFDSGFFEITTTDPEMALPPVNFDGTNDFPLPPGITLTIPEGNRNSEVEPGAPEANGDETRTLPVTAVVFNGDSTWALGRFSEPFVEFGDTVTGDGSVTVDNIPFSHFVPGTYTVEAQFERKLSSRQFQVTYKVIPFNAPQLSLTGRGQFPLTQVGRTRRTQRLTLANVGNVPVSRLSYRLTGDSSDFSVAAPRIKRLAPGASISLRARFRPSAKGTRRATLQVRSSAPTVSKALSGIGIDNFPNSPRFPRGLY